MKISELAEDGLIEVVRQNFNRVSPDLILGIGDDAAVLRLGRKSLIITKDLLIEGTHFRKRWHPPYLLGRKSLSVNVSDIAAMGGLPRYALLGIGIPGGTDPSWAELYFSGLRDVAEEEGVLLIGGDTTRAANLTISVTVLGEASKVITRKGGRPGDLLFVSGTLGDARMGLRLLKRGAGLGLGAGMDHLLQAFLDPKPQTLLGRRLGTSVPVTAMIDLSDGLSLDLARLCRESGCGAEIHMAKLPVSASLKEFSRLPYQDALHGGEDYQLLFSLPPERERMLSKLAKEFPLTKIGKMVSGRDISVIDRRGHSRKLEHRGFEHFPVRHPRLVHAKR